jgi:phosphatidylinositol glycan class O
MALIVQAPDRVPSRNLTQLSSTWLKHISRFNLAILLLLYVTSLHTIGLYIFTKGYLLTRSTISTVSPPYTLDHPAPIPATHSKAVILVIDALRTDFISPHYPNPKSSHHHGILTLPAELSKSRPDHSIIFNAYADPPTSSMQRLKALVTGSLPTFIDVGSNFASPAIDEDSIISQLVAHNKSVWFMGDDTWTSLFPDSFDQLYPYDSFNVEDLHTVDNGVVEHIFPSLHPDNSSKWDVLIGHFLGVDHVGHRVGPHRDVMQKKLHQMDGVLRDVVDKLDDDTLLVVLGDHGMDQKGNHGGDSALETSAGMWIYSKGKPLTTTLRSDPALAAARRTSTFPGSTTSNRHIDQIDITPTIAMMLGIPIPFNNLGSIIPECFGDITTLETATRANSEQIQRYINECGNAQVERYLESAWAKAADTPTSQPAESINAHRAASLLALSRFRSLWAEFSLPFISLGLAILALSLPTLWALYTGVKNNSTTWDLYARLALETAMMSGVVGGGAFGLITMIISTSFTLGLQIFLATFALSTEITLVLPLLFNTPRPSLAAFTIERAIGPIIVILHSVSFASNSFIDWEDRIVIFFFATIMLVYIVKAPTSPTAMMRWKIAGLATLAAILVRLVGSITVCREGQLPSCRNTFFAGLTPTAPVWVLVTFVPLATQLPRMVGYVLNLSRSNAGPAPTYLNIVLRTALTLNSLYWLSEWLESFEGLNADRIPLVGTIKLWIARASFIVLLLALPYKWITSSLCIEIKRDTAQVESDGAVTVFGFANAFGSTYMLFYLIPFTMIHLVSYPTAQITLSALLVAHMAYIELVDTRRDAIVMRRSFANSAQPGAFDASSATSVIVRPSFTDIVPLVLMGFTGFFATGHQAVLTSIQWKSAFVGFESVTYPFSPLFVILNAFGPLALSALFIPLLSTWNISPRPQSTIPILGHTLQLTLAFVMYHTALTFASAFMAAWHRRHLMAWTIFAPRFMLGGITLVVVDLSVLVAIGVGLRITSWKVWKTFKCESI